MNPLEDGTKHVNVSHDANTQLGRMLSPPYQSKFVLPDDGEFESVAGYWLWLVFDPNEGFREVSGETVFLRGTYDGAQEIVETQDFQEKILRATWHKIRQNNSIFWRFEQNILPYRRYYVGQGDIYKPSDAEWLCDGLKVMQDYIDQNFW